MIDQEILQKANAGDIEAVLALANKYYDGEDGYKSISKAYELYRRVLEHDPQNAFVINRIGNCFYNGFGVAKDEARAMEYYRKAAEMGYADAQYNYADSLYHAGNPDCIEWYEKAYRNGDKDALHEIVRIYREEKVVPADNARVADILQRGAEQGDPDAVCELACACLRGDFVAKDTAQGVSLMRRAAEAGNGNAAANMSILYRKGEGIEADRDASLEWAEKAAKLGCTDQLMEYGIAYFNGEEGFPQDREKAFRFFMIAAEAGDMNAMKNVGVCYDDGQGTETNKLDAIFWYEKAARKGLQEGFVCVEALYGQIYGRDGDRRYIDLLKEAAHKGYFKAMLLLHQCYLNGNHVEKDLAAAMRYLDDAVECENARACFMKGCYLMHKDIGIPKDEKEAVRLWKIAAEKGDSDAGYSLGKLYREGKGVPRDEALALQWFERAAERGNADAMLALGAAYDKDGFAGTDYTKAMKWYTKAYEAGSVKAAYCLGNMYEEGCGTAKNLDKAFEFYKFSAEGDFIYGIRKTGSFYLSGHGTEQDVMKAVEYIEKAIGMGDEELDPILMNIYFDYEVLGINPEKAFKYLLKKAREGNAKAQFWIHNAYTNGLGVEKDEIQARDWCRKAADNGHTKAQRCMGELLNADGYRALAVPYWEKASEGGDMVAMCQLGKVYLNGDEGTAVNKSRAIELLQRSAEKGYARAQVCLGVCYEDGNGVIKDENKAFSLYQEAARQNDTDSMFLLAKCYQFGVGTEVNIEQTLSWLRKADAQGDSRAQELIQKVIDLQKEMNEDPASGTLHCRHCGEEMSGDARFCSKCGKKLKASSIIPFLLILALPVVTVLRQSNLMIENYHQYGRVLFYPSIVLDSIGVAVVLFLAAKKKIDSRMFAWGDGIVWSAWRLAGSYVQNFSFIVVFGSLANMVYSMVINLTGIFSSIWFFVVLIIFMRVRCGRTKVSPKRMLGLCMIPAALSLLLCIGLQQIAESVYEVKDSFSGIFCLALCIRCIVLLWAAVLLGQRRMKSGVAIVCVLCVYIVTAVLCLIFVVLLHSGWQWSAIAEIIRYLARPLVLATPFQFFRYAAAMSPPTECLTA